MRPTTHRVRRQRLGRRLAACVLVGLAAAAADRARAQHPADSWEFGLEAGYLAKVRNNSPIGYRIAPVQAARPAARART